jgi:DNA topoisomerase-1
MYIDNPKKELSDEHLHVIKSLGLQLCSKYYTEVCIYFSKEANEWRAVAADKKGKIQYKYTHGRHQTNSHGKFERMRDLMKVFPKLKAKNSAVLKSSPVFSFNWVGALMLEIAFVTHMRTGKEDYARDNQTYALTSLEKRHCELNKEKGTVSFKFVGKKKVRVQYTVSNSLIVNGISALLRNCPGDKLFQYRESGARESDKRTKWRHFSHPQLAVYFHYLSRSDKFHFKDLRTLYANYYYLHYYLLIHLSNPKLDEKKRAKLTVQKVAKKLRHTEGISRKSYIDNRLVEFLSHYRDPNSISEFSEKKGFKLLLDIYNIIS